MDEYTIRDGQETFTSADRALYVADWSFGEDFYTSIASQTYPSAFHRFMQRLILGVYWRKR